MKTLLALLSTLVLAFVLIGTAPPPAQAKDPKYVGVAGCAKCHKKEKDGRQEPIWEKSKHSGAFKTLGTPKAKEAAMKIGVTGDPQKSEACLICHTAGYGEPASRFDKKFSMEDGVQCESCHGAGGDYKSKKVMKAINEERGPDKKGQSATAKKTGLVIPDEQSCKQCHVQEIMRNGKTFKNPSYEDFDFKKRWEKIKHPVPS